MLHDFNIAMLVYNGNSKFGVSYYKGETQTHLQSLPVRCQQ